MVNGRDKGKQKVGESSRQGARSRSATTRNPASSRRAPVPTRIYVEPTDPINAPHPRSYGSGSLRFTDVDHANKYNYLLSIPQFPTYHIGLGALDYQPALREHIEMLLARPVWRYLFTGFLTEEVYPDLTLEFLSL
jgi:hypothetical protein